MRWLVGPTCLPGADCRGAQAFGDPSRGIPYDPTTEPLGALFDRLPAGWTPDVLVWTAPEYTVLPEGLEDCPVRTVALLGDWTVNAWATLPMLEAFDYVLTDRAGVAALQRCGFQHVAHWRGYSFDPALHRRLPGVARDVDVLFIGNFNFHLYPDRERWVYRLVQLANRHHVVIASGIHGEAYARMLNRAKIVFNRSMRGEMNLRAYEAPAAGALLFLERENAEVGEVFEDRRHCVLYGDDDFEELIGYYLATPGEREAIARAGRARVHTETYGHAIHRLLLALEQILSRPAPPRRFRARPRDERDLLRAVKALLSAQANHHVFALRVLSRIRSAELEAAVAGTTATLLAMIGEATGDAKRLERASRLAALACAAAPRDPVHHARRAELLRAQGAWSDALRAFSEAAETALLASAEAMTPVPSVPYPFGWTRLRALWDASTFDTRAAANSRRHALLRAHALAGAAAILAGERRWDAAVAALEDAVSAAPEMPEALLLLAAARERTGAFDGAIRAYSRYLEMHPMSSSARRELARVLARSGDRSGAMAQHVLADRVDATVCRGTAPRPAMGAPAVQPAAGTASLA